MQGQLEQARTIGRVHTRRVRPTTNRPQPRHLAALLEAEAFVLHHCPAGDDQPSIDHVAVGSSGVWVIASRRTPLGRVHLRRSLLSAPKLLVGDVDHTALFDLLDHQRRAVCTALADQPGVPIHTAVAFAGGQFPFLGTLTATGHKVLPPKDLARHVGSSGPLTRARCRAVAELLDARLR